MTSNYTNVYTNSYLWSFEDILVPFAWVQRSGVWLTANFWKTGLLAFIIGIPAFLVPFAFILRPGLMMSGSPLNIIGVTLLSAVGLVCFIAALGIKSQTGFEVLRRVALGIGGILLLLFPIGIYSVVGAGLCLFAGWKVFLPLATRIIRAGRQE